MEKLYIFIFGILILLSNISAFAQNRQISITFDDLPAVAGGLPEMRAINTKLLERIKAEKVPVVGFVNEGKLYREGQIKERTELLRMWLDAGFELGNHTYSHIALDRTPIKDYQADVIRGEKVTRNLLSERKMTLRYFRHPQLRTGNTLEYKNALDAFLKGRGYTIAPVTIDNNEHVFAVVYSNAKAKGDKETVNSVAQAYIPYMESVVEFFENLSRESFGYEVKQVLLLHANELNADHFDKLAEMLKRRGYLFITLEEALKDKVYSLPDAQTNRGLSWIHRWRLAKNLELKEEPKQPEFINKLYNQSRQK